MTDILLLIAIGCIVVVGVLVLRLKASLAGGENSAEMLSRELREGRKEQAELQRGSHEMLTKSLNSLMERFDSIRSTLDKRVKELQEGNEKKLDEMRKVVDEKLQTALEKKLSVSFDRVSKQLAEVHKGLGEMQTLATGVGDLKKVLTNVKTRGTWAEWQLEAILEQIMAPGQYEKNVEVRPGSRERVEFAVGLPGSKDDPDSKVWLPIDSKFPIEDYVRLQEASESADSEGVQSAIKGLAAAVRSAAKDIHDKYIDPPNSTDFAILYLGTEGLYAEITRQQTVVTELQQKYRVSVAGPNTLAALLTSLRMGFQTLAIQNRSAEVWTLLGGVKMEFAKFGDSLDKVQRQLATAAKTIEEDLGRRTRAVQRKLRAVEELPEEEAPDLLQFPASDTPEAED